MNVKKQIRFLQYHFQAPFIRDDTILGNSTILSGMGRSGTTWVGELINHQRDHRVLFEPFYTLEVPQARKFKHIQYMPPSAYDGELARTAREILGGRVHNYWVDRHNRVGNYHHRLIKDIRINLMLAWLQSNADDCRLVLIIRHPLQVALSWLRMGWGKQVTGSSTALDIIMNQAALLRDYPIISKVAEEIDSNDLLQTIVFQWCINHIVPRNQLSAEKCHVVFYEDLLLRQENTINALFNYLEQPVDHERLQQTIDRASPTNYLKRDMRANRKALVDGWKQEIENSRINTAMQIVDAFDLDDLYGIDSVPQAPFFRVQ